MALGYVAGERTRGCQDSSLEMMKTGYTSPVMELEASLLPTKLWPRYGQNSSSGKNLSPRASHAGPESLRSLFTVEFLSFEGDSSGKSLEHWVNPRGSQA